LLKAHHTLEHAQVIWTGIDPRLGCTDGFVKLPSAVIGVDEACVDSR
jgi:hypothetical protein